MYQNWIMFCATLFGAATAMAETHTVLANNTSFVPNTLEVLPGDTIIWQYNSGYPHTVVSGVDCTASGLFYGELPSFGDTFSWEVPLDLSGEFSYFCAPHCGNGMTGLITVADDVCELTRPDVEGPYWLPDSPERSNLRTAGDGPLLDLNLQILDEDCLPVPAAWIDIWQADGQGEYDKKGWGYRGHHFADSDGASLLETVVPGLYPGRTSHIHVKVQGMSSTIFTTQLYFPDVPENDDDFFYHPDLEVTVLDEDIDGNMLAAFEFVIDDTNACPGDLDLDGEVGVNDLLALLAAYEQNDEGDCDGDGDTDVNDVLFLINVWGACF